MAPYLHCNHSSGIFGLEAKRGRMVCIWTEGKSNLQGLGNHTNESKIVRVCFKVVNDLANTNKATLMWVAGHKSR